MVECPISSRGNADKAKSAECRPSKLKPWYVAMAFSVAGLALCWSPVVGTAHALAGTILGALLFGKTHCRYALYAAIVGAVAAIASIVITIIEAGSIALVDTYDASPWM